MSIKTSSTDKFFISESLPRNLKVHALQGGVVIVASQGVKFFLQALSTIVLARLLSPSDYGLVAMVAVLTGFLSMFKDMGLSVATIQKADITHAQISTLFWINLILSLCLVALTAVLAPVISWFYGDKRLFAVAIVLGTTFIFNGITVQHQALLKKRLRFVMLAGIEIGSMVAGITFAIVLALRGAGYWALVSNSVVQAVVSMVLTFYFCPWNPGLMRKNTEVRDMLKFGGYLTGFNFVTYLSRKTDNVLIAKFIGAEATGIYTTAYTLFMLPIAKFRAPLDQIAMPVLSALRGQPDRYRKYYQRLLNILATVILPVYFYFIIEADFIVRLTLGRNWLGVIPIFRILAIAGLVQGVATTRGVVLLSSGLSQRYFYWGVISACTYVIAFMCGIPYGVKGIATAYTITAYAMLFPSLIYCFHRTPITVSLFIATLITPLAINLFAAGGLVLLKSICGNDSNHYHCFYLCAFVAVSGGISYCRLPVRDTLQTILTSLRSRSVGKTVAIEI